MDSIIFIKIVVVVEEKFESEIPDSELLMKAHIHDSLLYGYDQARDVFYAVAQDGYHTKNGICFDGFRSGLLGSV